jgi:hypothetical protein
LRAIWPLRLRLPQQPHDRNNQLHRDTNGDRDSDANTNTYSNCITYTYPDADPMHGEMSTDAAAAPYPRSILGINGERQRRTPPTLNVQFRVRVDV